MLIIPAIDLLRGRAVRLVRGKFDAVTDFGDPLVWLERWHTLGAETVHVVDLEGARDGVPVQTDLIREMASSGVSLQVGGGVREQSHVENLLEMGVDRVVMGTAAITNIDLVSHVAADHGEALVGAIDARDGMVATHGWSETTEVSASELARQLSDIGVSRFLVTDIGRDGTMTEPNYTLLEEVMTAGGRPVIASGGVSTLDAVSSLRRLGLEAAICGRALYSGLFEFADAREAADAG
ncbi:MAG TPA: 1-(5-phosphoribosyl)-5-[(5-phosphoribosylamino)methylideneamino]imidazole-4-carboxamide isomerase [Chloroflexota bacterium]|nr:1-(5-phosphoribosyl)-5-[(5-phosphoribosylamino)methylideneamino]imidazole-4-carboxamide isomerase [Chloroflexota bacterium]